MEKSKVRFRLAYKVYLIVFISVFFCAAVIGISNYYENKRMVGENIGEGLKKIAQTAVLAINIDTLKAITSPKDLSYREISNYLVRVKQRNDIKSPIYILKYADRKRASLILSTEPAFLPGVEYTMNPTMKKVFEEGKSGFSPIYKDKSGTWISAYAPIRDIDGSIQGIIELNQEIGYYIRQLKLSLLRIIMLCLVGCLVGVLLGIPLFKPMLHSINTLSASARQIEKGNYDGEIELKTSDEIGELACAMDTMRLSIKEYIRELKEAQDDLIRSEKLATIGKLSGMVGHELRTPLGVIRNSVYFLRMKLEGSLKDEKVKKHLDILDAEVNISDKIINDILTFGRVKKPQLARHNINDIIKDCLKKISVPENVKVIMELKEGLADIMVDEYQISQVISNVVLNGIQAMPKGGKLTISAKKKDKFIEIAVIDTGEGIPEENLNKIFDPLFSTKAQGTGLGLSTCKSIMDGHKGIIEVESKVGKGTAFILKLPEKVLI